MKLNRTKKVNPGEFLYLCIRVLIYSEIISLENSRPCLLFCGAFVKYILYFYPFFAAASPLSLGSPVNRLWGECETVITFDTVFS